jgi:hypothetical protein
MMRISPISSYIFPVHFCQQLDKPIRTARRFDGPDLWTRPVPQPAVDDDTRHRDDDGTPIAPAGLQALGEAVPFVGGWGTRVLGHLDAKGLDRARQAEGQVLRVLQDIATDQIQEVQSLST